jgi:r-opsin
MNPFQENVTNLIRTARAIQPNIHYGYPPGVSLTDFVTDEMNNNNNNEGFGNAVI